MGHVDRDFVAYLCDGIHDAVLVIARRFVGV